MDSGPSHIMSIPTQQLSINSPVHETGIVPNDQGPRRDPVYFNDIALSCRMLKQTPAVLPLGLNMVHMSCNIHIHLSRQLITSSSGSSHA
ncbi:hypothetical protein N7468_007477 [Penicillium chermesinum]|uniref:Uncharacterized protein n=1 Tax=Penicillium chermesinum TaxID=63820 RepID=A0A9W9NUF3_9EURO|nr:uncharacterized protein N7468_007477 [Penicillium chermesinum]KAJ5226252.1 hypothetical protein N7468_007477 [Penicillium chermesinum]